jgi:outer membrane immunogenic protein
VNEDDAEGPQYGGGIEYALAPNLTLTGEYLYSDLDTGDFTVRFARGGQPATNPFILPPNVNGTDVTRTGDAFRTHAFRIGMNVRF